jgi:hypothetical protein
MDRSNTVPTAVTFVIFVGLVIGGFFLIKNLVISNQEKNREEAIKEIGELPNVLISINGEYFTAITQVSYAAKNFVSTIPVSIEMSDIGSKMKKGCSSLVKFSGDTAKAKEIERGDVLVYEDSCIVIAYESFKGGSKYKKIGHINNMAQMPTGTYTVSFSPIK